MGFKVNEKGVFVTSAGVALRDKDLPTLRWGDGFSISIVLPAGSVAAEDRFCLAVDVDRFLGNGLCALSETATIDVANNTVSFDGIATNTQKFLNAVNGKAGCIEGQMQLVRYVGGDLSERQTLLDDRCMLKGLVYVNGATVYILDPNAAYTKEQVDAIFATAVVFQFSADGENWHDEQVDADVFLRFKNPAVETAAWSDSIRFQRSDIVPLVERAENAATEAETAKGKAETAQGKAEAARDEAVSAKTAALDAKATATQKASETADNAALAVSAKNAAVNAANTANQKATVATNAANAAAGHAVEANAAKTAAQNSANAAAGAVATVNGAKTAVASDKAAVADMKGEVQTMKQAVVEASESAANSKTAAVNAANIATQKATQATNAANAAANSQSAAAQAANEAQTAYTYIQNNTQWLELTITVDDELILTQYAMPTITFDISDDGDLLFEMI